jgi:3-methyl-2-oxobutanoate hydroxymethyltransferase
MDDMLHHCKAVARGAQYALLIGDMPFMSYQVSVEQAVANAGRFLQEAGMDAVKLEGGVERAEAVRQIVAATGICRFTGHSPGGYWFDYELTERDTTTLNDPRSGTRNR